MLGTCFSKCLKKQSSMDDGEWIQPVNKANKRHVAPVKESTMGNRASRASRATVSISAKDLESNRVSWSHLVKNLDNLDIDDLDRVGSAFDESLMKSIAEREQMRDSQLHDTMGRLTMGSLYSEDSVSRGLGGFTRSSYGRETSSSLGSNEYVAGSSGKKIGFTSAISDLTATSSGSEVVGILRGSTFEKKEGESALTKRKGSGKELFKTNVQKVMFAAASLQQFAKASSRDEASSNSTAFDPKHAAITSIAVLGDGFFLTASRSEHVIKMHKTVGKKVEFVREFQGGKAGVTALATLDKKGRFLSAGIDNTIILWDSRFDIEEESDEEAGMEQEPRTLLATFHGFERYVHSIKVLNEGLFVRPDDGVDMAMVTAMAKKTALEGAASVQRAAFERKVIECSGSFATCSKNDKNVKVHCITVAKDGDGNAAKIHLEQELEHGNYVGAMAAMKNIILAGDIVGVVHMWERKRGSFGNKGSWEKVHEFSPWNKTRAVRTPEQMMEQSVEALCFLDKGTFVSGTKNGVVRVWPDIEALKDFEVHKKQASSVKVTSQSATGIPKLPPVRDPNTGEKCLAFSVGFNDGRMVSMAMYPDKGRKTELVMFHVYTNVCKKETIGINAIAVSEGLSGSNNTSFGSISPVLIAGDRNGEIKTIKPKWSSSSSASI